jgi:hypothetical protein
MNVCNIVAVKAEQKNSFRFLFMIKCTETKEGFELTSSVVPSPILSLFFEKFKDRKPL